ncbi:hypothetical protein KMI_18g19960 [Encephalitozoon hellem]|nr:hypothetical protein KMI_18g19960 [Encephalitozoon hellem]
MRSVFMGCVHGIYILVVRSERVFRDGGWDEEVKGFCSAGWTDKELNGDGGLSVGLLYGLRELWGVDSSVFDEVMNKE